MAIFAGCKPATQAVKSVVNPSSAGPQIAATVITIQTTIQPGNRSFTHALVVGGGKARSSDEIDRWRLFDLDRETVTFVDDIARTYYTQPFAELVLSRQAAVRKPLPAEVPRAQFASTGARRVLQGVEAAQKIIRLGAYQRELWVGTPRSVPSKLFAMLQAAAPLDDKYAPVMRDVDAALLDLRGFPLADHAELPYGNNRIIIDRTVSRIEQRNVPESYLNVGSKYKEVTAPGVNPPPGASPPPGRNTRAAG